MTSKGGSSLNLFTTARECRSSPACAKRHLWELLEGAKKTVITIFDHMKMRMNVIVYTKIQSDSLSSRRETYFRTNDSAMVVGWKGVSMSLPSGVQARCASAPMTCSSSVFGADVRVTCNLDDNRPHFALTDRSSRRTPRPCRRRCSHRRRMW